MAEDMSSGVSRLLGTCLDRRLVPRRATVVAGGANPTGIDPDFNQDGSVDQDDVADFIRALSGG
jgi:hypothetical protein